MMSNFEKNLAVLSQKFQNVKFDLDDTDYELVKIIGSGAYGVVCSAVHRTTRNEVAIKKIPKIFENVVLAKRTLREIKILKCLKHENVVEITDILLPKEDFEDFEDVYISMDLMETDLSEIIRSKQQLTDEHIRYFFYQIVCGLKYIHSANIIHRDLKPSNLLVNSNCLLKIADFGMARCMSSDEGDRNNLLMTWYVATRWYRAPELMLFKQKYTGSVDVWSVGCILAELLGRRPLFPGRNFVNQIQLIFGILGTPNEDFISISHADRIKDFLRNFGHKSAIPLKEIYPLSHPKAIRLLEKMLKLNPNERINVNDILKDLYVNQFHDPNNEPVCSKAVSFDLNEENQDTFSLRKLIYEEIVNLTKKKKSSIFSNAEESEGSSETDYKKIVPSNSLQQTNISSNCLAQSNMLTNSLEQISLPHSMTQTIPSNCLTQTSIGLNSLVAVPQTVPLNCLVQTESSNSFVDTIAPSCSFAPTDVTMMTSLNDKCQKIKCNEMRRKKSRVPVRRRPKKPMKTISLFNEKGERLDVKAILKDSILYGYQNEGKTLNDSQTIKRQSKCKTKDILAKPLTEEDENLLKRWSEMQKKKQITEPQPPAKSKAPVVRFIKLPLLPPPAGGGGLLLKCLPHPHQSINKSQSFINNSLVDDVRDSCAGSISEINDVIRSSVDMRDSSTGSLTKLIWTPSVQLTSADIRDMFEEHSNDEKKNSTSISQPDKNRETVSADDNDDTPPLLCSVALVTMTSYPDDLSASISKQAGGDESNLSIDAFDINSNDRMTHSQLPVHSGSGSGYGIRMDWEDMLPDELNNLSCISTPDTRHLSDWLNVTGPFATTDIEDVLNIISDM